jgi:hypothetical protein
MMLIAHEMVLLLFFRLHVQFFLTKQNRKLVNNQHHERNSVASPSSQSASLSNHYSLVFLLLSRRWKEGRISYHPSSPLPHPLLFMKLFPFVAI